MKRVVGRALRVGVPEVFFESERSDWQIWAGCLQKLGVISSEGGASAPSVPIYPFCRNARRSAKLGSEAASKEALR